MYAIKYSYKCAYLIQSQILARNCLDFSGNAYVTPLTQKCLAQTGVWIHFDFVLFCGVSSKLSIACNNIVTVSKENVLC
jgi:hypothetical protein